MPSFDVVSEVDLQEVKNAVDQTKKELGTRYDFRGSKSSIEYDDQSTITLVGDDDMKLEALKQMLNQKMSKRGVSLKSLQFKDPEDAAGSLKRQIVTLVQGIKTDEAKKIVKQIKDQKLKKIQASIQGEQIRVTGPKRDDLQNVIQFLKDNVAHLELQFVNFRD